MKPLICILLGCWLFNTALGQDSTIALSQFEAFTTQSNKVFKTETQELGTMGGRTITGCKATDLASGKIRKAVRIGFNRTGRQPLVYELKAFYIDAEELDTLVDVLTRFVQIASGAPPSGFVQYSFVTSGDITFSGLYDPVNGTWDYSMGKLYKNMRTIVPYTYDTFNRKRFAEWVSMLRRAKTLQW